MIRPSWSTIRPALPALSAGGATAFVAATAFVLAYGGSKGAALDAGMDRRAAGWYPLCIEGVIVAASVATVVLPKLDRTEVRGLARLRPGPRWFPWVVLLGFSALSAAANVLHALDQEQPKWWAPIAAAVPPLALPICVRLAERVALTPRATSTQEPDEIDRSFVNVAPLVAEPPAVQSEPPAPPPSSIPSRPRVVAASSSRTVVTAYTGPPPPFTARDKGPCDCPRCNGKAVSWNTWRNHHDPARA